MAYYGVSQDVKEGSRDISKETFAERLRLLRENGYTPITLRDVQAFYKEGKPCPQSDSHNLRAVAEKFVFQIATYCTSTSGRQ